MAGFRTVWVIVISMILCFGSLASTVIAEQPVFCDDIPAYHAPDFRIGVCKV